MHASMHVNGKWEHGATRTSTVLCIFVLSFVLSVGRNLQAKGGWRSTQCVKKYLGKNGAIGGGSPWGNTYIFSINHVFSLSLALLGISLKKRLVNICIFFIILRDFTRFQPRRPERTTCKGAKRKCVDSGGGTMAVSRAAPGHREWDGAHEPTSSRIIALMTSLFMATGVNPSCSALSSAGVRLQMSDFGRCRIKRSEMGKSLLRSPS